MTQSTGPRASRKALAKPKKPYPDFPLTPHPRGQWCKKIRGQLHYFGHWARRLEGVLIPITGEDGWKPALEEYNRVKDDLYAGRKPRPKDDDGLTVKKLFDHFLSAKLRKVEAGELSSMMHYS